MPKYLVTLSDGRSFEVESDTQPTEDDVYAALGDQAPEATPPPAAATAGMPAPSTAADTVPPFLRGVEVMDGPLVPPLGAIPGILSKVGGGVGKAVQAVSRAASKPSVGAVAGAAEEGYRTGGNIKSMAVGALAGAGGGSWLGTLLGKGRQNVAKGMSQAGAAAANPALARSQALEQMLRTGSLDDLASFVGKPGTKAVTRPSDALAKELLARDIDWRITDAVPIDAMARAQGVRGGSIIQAGESLPGLGEQLATALKRGDATEADQLARAIRQRMHITSKVQGR